MTTVEASCSWDSFLCSGRCDVTLVAETSASCQSQSDLFPQAMRFVKIQKGRFQEEKSGADAATNGTESDSSDSDDYWSDMEQPVVTQQKPSKKKKVQHVCCTTQHCTEDNIFSACSR